MQEIKIIIAPKEAITVSESAVHMTIQAIINILKVTDEMDILGMLLSSGMEQEAARRRADKVYKAKRQCRIALDALTNDTQDALCYIAT